MSTGSSEESSGSSGLQDEVLSPTLASDQAMFAWPNYSVSPCPSSQNAEQEHRSVSQIGEPPDTASETSSDAYIKMENKVLTENNERLKKAVKERNVEVILSMGIELPWVNVTIADIDKWMDTRY